MSKPLFRLKETSAPAVEPLSLAEAKAHLRVTHADDDTLISALVKTAREMAEAFTGRAFITRNISLFLDGWPARHGAQWWDGVREGAGTEPADMALSLPRAPLFSVTDIRVYSAADEASTYAASGYFVDTTGPRGRIVLKDSAVPPTPGRNASGIEVRYTAGYGATSTAVPAPIIEALRQTVAHLYANRGDTNTSLPAAARGLLQPYRLLGDA